MTKVFIAGSRQIARLPAEVRSRIDTMVEKGFQILVGDANGADKAVQRYLADKAYPNVLVHCMENHCRNNIGAWSTFQVAAPKGARGFDYDSLKDRAMSDAAEYGLMLWDGKSKGTINRGRVVPPNRVLWLDEETLVVIEHVERHQADGGEDDRLGTRPLPRAGGEPIGHACLQE